MTRTPPRPYCRRPARTVPPRLRGDDGSVILELAMVAPFMVMLLLGVFEFGTVFHNESIVASALRGAARVESQNPDQMQDLTTSPTTPSVDQLAIQTFMAGISGLRNMTLQRLIIYDAPVGGVAPTNCRNLDVTTAPLAPHGRPSPNTTATMQAPVVGTACNVYSLAQVQAVQGGTAPASAFANDGSGDCTIGTTGSWDQFYCPKYRHTSLGSLDLIGVYAVFTYTDITSLLPSHTMTISDQAIYTAQPSV